MNQRQGRNHFFATRAHCWEADSVLSWSGRGKVNILFLSALPRSVAFETFLPKKEGLEVMGSSGLLWGGQHQADPTVHSSPLAVP